MGTVSIAQFDRPFAGVGQVTRNTCIVAPGRSDRSPTGTGTCARMAVLHAHGGRQAGHPADDRGPGVDHRAGQRYARSERPLPDGLCAARILGRQRHDFAVANFAQVRTPVQVRWRFRSKLATVSDPIPSLGPTEFRHMHLARTSGVGRPRVSGAASGTGRDGTTERLHVAVSLMI